MLALLIIAALAGVSAFSDGAGVCFVAGDYTGVNATVMLQNRNPNFGTFVATARSNQTVTTTYKSGESLTITIASNGTDRIAGILGYFADTAQLEDPTHLINETSWQGWWNSVDNYTQILWPSCEQNGITGFTHGNTSVWGLSRSEVSVEWLFWEPMWYQANEYGQSFETSMNISVIHKYSGTLYWIFYEHDPLMWTPPTREQIKAGLRGDGQNATWSRNLTYIAPAELKFNIDGLEPDSHYTMYFFIDVIDPPTLSFQAYVLAGERGNSSSQQFYRTVMGDFGNLVLTPATVPLASSVQEATLHTQAPPKSIACTVGPAMFIISLCQWIVVSSQIF